MTADPNAARGPDRAELYTVTLLLTGRCNLRCAYCGQRRRAARSMDWPTARAGCDLALAAPSDDVVVAFSGGEPLLEFDLLRRAVGYLDRRCGQRSRSRPRIVRTVVQTNGLLIDRRVATFLADRRCEVRLSHDGVPAAQRQRGAGTFGRLDQLLSWLRSEQSELFRRRLRVAVTLTAANASSLADSVEYLVGKGVRDIAITPAVTEDAGSEGDHRDLLREQFARVAAFSRRHFAATDEIPVRLLRGPAVGAAPANAAPPAGDQLCAVGDGTGVTVDTDGRLCACAAFAPSLHPLPAGFLRDAQRALIGGWIRSAVRPQPRNPLPLRRVLPRIFTHRLAKYSRYGRCAECPYLSRCLICPAGFGDPHGRGDPDRVPAFLCAFNQAALYHAQRFDGSPSPAQTVRNPDLMLDQLPDWLRYAAVSRSIPLNR